MEFQNPKDLKPKAARQLALDLQIRMLDLENCLDDLMRAVEIAQYTKQFNVTEVFIRDAEALLKDRIVVPEHDQSNNKFTIVEASEEGLEKGLDILNQDPTIEKRKHGAITGIVDQDGSTHEHKKRGNIHTTSNDAEV
jgi:hypothetical protein